MLFLLLSFEIKKKTINIVIGLPSLLFAKSSSWNSHWKSNFTNVHFVFKHQTFYAHTHQIWLCVFSRNLYANHAKWRAYYWLHRRWKFLRTATKQLKNAVYIWCTSEEANDTDIKVIIFRVKLCRVTMTYLLI